MTNNQVKGTIIAGFVVIVTVGIISYYSIESAKINAEKEKVITEIEQREETERTEERSQFWQKAIFWGKDEDEEGRSTQPTVNQGE